MPSQHYADDADRPIVGNVYVPDSMEAKGHIMPVRTVNAETRNGLRELVPFGFPAFTWRFDSLLNSELDWWFDLIGFNPAVNIPYSKRFVTVGSMPAFRLWAGALPAPYAYKVGILELPTYEEYRNKRFYNVTVNITGLIPS